MNMLLRLLTLLSLLAAAVPASAQYTISVLFIRTADDNGANAGGLTEATAKAAIAGANTVYARNGGDVQFVMDPANNFSAVVNNTTLNHDCKLPPGASAATIAKQTTQVADPDTLCDTGPAVEIRNAMALACPGKLVVFSRGGSEYVKWNPDLKHYELLKASGGHSGGSIYYVAFGSQFSGNDLAHEMGHYFHLPHTFGVAPKTVIEAQQAIKSYVDQGHAEADGLRVFEGDGFTDTPPDAAGSVFVDKYGANANCDANHPTVPLTVKFAKQSHTYTLAPDRNDVMSYFKHCPGFDQHFTKQQYAVIHDALDKGNRTPLISLPLATGNGCSSRDPLVNCALQAPKPPQDPKAQLAASARYLQNCYKLWRKPLPGEINELVRPESPVIRMRLPANAIER
jgi:hypothetical protein